jgi:hypothetical protein
MRVITPMAARAADWGFAPGYLHLLDVRGRKTGVLRTTPVAVMDVAGDRWLSRER